MKKLFPLLIIAMSILVSCQKKSVEPFPAPVNSVVNPLSLTDSTKLALFNTTFTIVADYLGQNQNYCFVDTSYGYKRMYDTWTIDAVGNCTVTPYTYSCYSTYVYNANNFPFSLQQYSNSLMFSITIHNDTIDMPWANSFALNRVTGSNFTINQLVYRKTDPLNIGTRCFESTQNTIINRYCIK